MVAPVTERLATFIVDAEFSNISAKALWNGKLHILDTLGAALAATHSPVGAIALGHCGRIGGVAEATVWGSACKAPAALAAFTNGLLAHAMDFDDWDAVVHVGHPSCMVVAAAWAVGEGMGASGEELLKAYVLGIEIATQIASGPKIHIHKRGFHSTPIFGGMGSVAAAASLARLTKDAIKAAFGIAASAAGGIHRQQGTMVKPFHAGNAARSGVEAVLLAQEGFTADSAIFEAARGFCDTFFGAGACDYERMLAGLGHPYYLESPGLAFKLHPCSAPQFLAVDATLHLVREHRIGYESVRKVEVGVTAERYERHYHPSVRSGLQGKFAINYVSAVAVLDGKLEKESFSDSKVCDPRVQEAVGKVEVFVDPEIPESGEYCPVTIELKDGTRLSHTARIPKGHPDNPLTEEELFEKFRGNVREVISPKRSEELIASIMELETVSDIRQLTRLLTPV